jgi:hypothetical protein
MTVRADTEIQCEILASPQAGCRSGIIWRARIAQPIAAYESSCITKLYDRTGDEITLDEIERITV